VHFIRGIEGFLGKVEVAKLIYGKEFRKPVDKSRKYVYTIFWIGVV